MNTIKKWIRWIKRFRFRPYLVLARHHYFVISAGFKQDAKGNVVGIEGKDIPCGSKTKVEKRFFTKKGLLRYLSCEGLYDALRQTFLSGVRFISPGGRVTLVSIYHD